MKIIDRPITLPPGIYRQPNGGFYARVKVGSRGSARTDHRSFEPGTAITTIEAWQRDARDALLTERQAGPARGTLRADVLEYLRDAGLTAANTKRRKQQLAWWCAQPAALGAPVVSVKDLATTTPLSKAKTLGDLPRTKLDLKRIREILREAFKPTDEELDPTEFATTSNHYRMALYHLFTVLDQDDPEAVNPIGKVKIRPTSGARLAGQDMRVVAAILKHFPSRFGRDSRVSQIRLGVLAWVHITPKQLQQLADPLKAFHDLPDATREEIIDGAITLTKPPRHKGRAKRVPAPETIPLTPYGVEAMRAFVAEPAAWGKFSLPSLNKGLKRACTRAQAALAEQGFLVDLSSMSLYHLKHSLATVASIASAGLVDRRGIVQQSPGVQRAIDHARGSRATLRYTAAAVDPILRFVNAATARYLDHLFTVPLTAAPLRLIPKAADASQ